MLDCDSFQKFNDPENREGYVCFSYISYGTSTDKSIHVFSFYAMIALSIKMSNLELFPLILSISII